MALAQLKAYDHSYRFSGSFGATATGFSDQRVRKVAAVPETVGVFSQESDPEWLADMDREIGSLCLLPVGWDGYNGIPVDINIAVWSFQLMSNVVTASTTKPSFVPLSGGGLQIEWHRKGKSLEVAIYEPYDVEVIFTNTSGEQEEFELEADVGRLKDIMKEIAG